MTTPVPAGIKARFASAWAYLKVPAKSGYAAEVEAYQNGQWERVQKWGSEYPIAMYAHGSRTEWRARYTRSGTPGEWRTGRVWVPDNFEEDGDTPPPSPYPDPPGGLGVTSTDPDGGTAAVAWDDPGDARVSYWQVLLEGEQRWRTARNLTYLFQNLTSGTRYGWRVKAVIEDAEGYTYESDPSRGPEFQLDDTPPPPPPEAPHAPRNVRAHCVHARHAKVEWDPNSDAVDGYRIELSDGGHREQIGTLAEISGLTPETDYTATVYAHRGGQYSTGSACQVTTGSDEPNPDPPDPDAPDPPSGLYVDPVAPGRVRAEWNHPTEPDTWWLASIDDRTWYRVTQPSVEFTGVPAATQRTVQVYALVDGTRGNPTRISRITSGGVVTARQEVVQ